MNTNELQAVGSQDQTVGPALNLKGLNLRQIAYIGDAMSKSGMFPDVKDGPKALVKILAGQEIGVTPFQAMTNIHIIQGKATMSANLMASKLKGSGKYDYRLDEISSDRCTVTVYDITGEKKDKLGSFTFSMEDAKRAGLIKGGSGWEKYPQNMLFARAISTAVRMFAPDIFNGNVVYSPDEMGGDVDENGDFIRGSVIEVEDEPPAQPSEPAEGEVVPPAGVPEPVVEAPEDTPEDVPDTKPTKAKTEEHKRYTRDSAVERLHEVMEALGITSAADKKSFSQTHIEKDRPTLLEDYVTLIVEAEKQMKEIT